MTTMHIDFHLRSDKINFDFSDLISCGEIEKNNIGDIDNKSKEIIPYCNWYCITVKKKNHYIDSDDVIRDFYNAIKINFKKIKERIKKLDLEVYMCIVVTTESEEDTYSLNISKEMILFLNEISANLDFDLYLFLNNQ